MGLEVLCFPGHRLHPAGRDASSHAGMRITWGRVKKLDFQTLSLEIGIQEVCAESKASALAGNEHPGGFHSLEGWGASSAGTTEVNVFLINVRHGLGARAGARRHVRSSWAFLQENMWGDAGGWARGRGEKHLRPL